MPFLAHFSCLWCGRAWQTRGPDDLEGWAQLCPDCVGAAGDDGFRRMRVRVGLAERSTSGSVLASASASGSASVSASGSASVPATASMSDPALGASVPAFASAPSSVSRMSVERVPTADHGDDVLRAYYRARAATYDDWYLRHGAYSHGPIDDLAWTMDLDQATLWLDALPLSGEIVELAAGTGWWSPLLAGKGELWCYDAVPETLDLARRRLLAHGLRAHLHERDAWAEPDRQVEALFCGFWLSHVPRARLGDFLALCARWLKPGGTFAFIDSRLDPASGAAGNDWDPATETAVRRISGASYPIPKVYYAGEELHAALEAAGFVAPMIQATPRFFLLGSARVSA